MEGEHAAHAAVGEFRIAQQGAVGKAEELGEMDERARALLTADHDEVILQPGAFGAGVGNDMGGREGAAVERARRRPWEMPRLAESNAAKLAAAVGSISRR